VDVFPSRRGHHVGDSLAHCGVGEVDRIIRPQQAVAGEGGYRLPNLDLRQTAEFGQQYVLRLAAEHGKGLCHRPHGLPPLAKPQQSDPG
jgi:hypothetical protein